MLTKNFNYIVFVNQFECVDSIIYKAIKLVEKLHTNRTRRYGGTNYLPINGRDKQN